MIHFDDLCILHFVRCLQIRDWLCRNDHLKGDFRRHLWMVSWRGDCCTERCSWPWCLPHRSQRLLGSMDACTHYCECLVRHEGTVLSLMLEGVCRDLAAIDDVHCEGTKVWYDILRYQATCQERVASRSFSDLSDFQACWLALPSCMVLLRQWVLSWIAGEHLVPLANAYKLMAASRFLQIVAIDAVFFSMNLIFVFNWVDLRTIKTTHKGQPWKGPLQFEDPTGRSPDLPPEIFQFPLGLSYVARWPNDAAIRHGSGPGETADQIIWLWISYSKTRNYAMKRMNRPRRYLMCDRARVNVPPSAISQNPNRFVLRGQELSQVRGDVCQGAARWWAVERQFDCEDCHQFCVMSFKTRDKLQDDSRFQKDFAQVVGKLFGFGPESFWTFNQHWKIVDSNSDRLVAELTSLTCSWGLVVKNRSALAFSDEVIRLTSCNIK